MRYLIRVLLALALLFYAMSWLHAQAPAPPPPARATTRTLDAVIDRSHGAESAVTARPNSVHRIAEVYAGADGAAAVIGTSAGR